MRLRQLVGTRHHDLINPPHLASLRRKAAFKCSRTPIQFCEEEKGGERRVRLRDCRDNRRRTAPRLCRTHGGGPGATAKTFSRTARAGAGPSPVALQNSVRTGSGRWPRNGGWHSVYRGGQPAQNGPSVRLRLQILPHRPMPHAPKRRETISSQSGSCIGQ